MTNYLTGTGVQQVQITIPSGSTSSTATISTVGSLAYVLMGGINPSLTNIPARDFASVTLTNSTTVTATRNTGTTGTVVIDCCVVDATSSLIASVQYGTITIAASSTSGTASISAVTNTNAAVHLLGWQSANTSYSGINENPVLSLSGTTVTATRLGTTGALVVSFVVIEFNGASLNQNVQQLSVTSSSSVTSYTSTITSVNPNNAITIYGGSQIATSTTNLAQIKQYGSLTNATTFTVHVNTAVANAKKYNATVVEFISGVLNSSVQRGVSTLSGTTSIATTTTPTILANTALSWLGNTTTATTAVLNESEGASYLGILGAAIVQSTIAAGSTGTSVTVSTDPTASGNLIVTAIQLVSGTATVTGVVDNQGQTWNQTTGAQGSASGFHTDIWYVPNSVAGVTSVTINYSSTAANYVSFYEVSDIATSSPLDVVGSVSGTGSSTSVVTAALTTTQADFIVTVIGSTSISSGVNNGYVADGLNNYTAYKLATTALSADSATFTISPAQATCSSSASFFVASPQEAVYVTKNNSTANITGSWEVIEFTNSLGSSGNAAGTSTVTGSAIAIAQSVATASGTSTVIASPATVGIVSGTSTVAGVGRAIFSAVGSAVGNSNALGIGQSASFSVATASGTSTVAATGVSGTFTVATASGTSTVAAVGQKQIIGVATASGTSTVAGVTHPTFSSLGTAAGISTVLGATTAIVYSVGHAVGQALVSGAAPVTPEAFALLELVTQVPVNAISTMSNQPVAVLGSITNTLSIRGFISNQNVNIASIINNTPVTVLESFL